MVRLPPSNSDSNPRPNPNLNPNLGTNPNEFRMLNPEPQPADPILPQTASCFARLRVPLSPMAGRRHPSGPSDGASPIRVSLTSQDPPPGGGVDREACSAPQLFTNPITLPFQLCPNSCNPFRQLVCTTLIHLAVTWGSRTGHPAIQRWYHGFQTHGSLQSTTCCFGHLLIDEGRGHDPSAMSTVRRTGPLKVPPAPPRVLHPTPPPAPLYLPPGPIAASTPQIRVMAVDLKRAEGSNFYRGNNRALGKISHPPLVISVDGGEGGIFVGSTTWSPSPSCA